MKLEFVKRIDVNNIAKAGIVLAVVIAEALKPDKDYITLRREEYIKDESERVRNESIRNEKVMNSFFNAFLDTTSEEEIVCGIKNAAINETSEFYKYEKAKKIRNIMLKNDRIKTACVRALFEIANTCKAGSYYKRRIEDMTMATIYDDDITWFSF